MEELKITLNNSEDIKRFYVYTKDGHKTGDYLEFDLEDIELLDKLEKAQEEIIKNHNWIKGQLVIIDKKQDFKDKNKIMSNNERLKYEAIKTFYKNQRNAYELFLGENGVDKLLYGRKFEWNTLREIDDIILNQIKPELNISMKNITEKIKKNYKNKEEIEVLE